MTKNEKDYINEIKELKAEIDAYQMSENEANEIIAELKHTLDCKNGTIETLKAENIKFTLDSKKLVAQYSAKLERLKDIIKSISQPVLLPDVPIEVTNKYKQTLQEIKAIAEECTTCGDCFNCKYTEHCSTDIEAQALGVCRMILKLISKAEEEFLKEYTHLNGYWRSKNAR